MKKIISLLLAAILMASCLCVGAGAELQLTSKSITVNTGIKINVDGKEFVPVDSEGAAVEVFLYNGTTYLPVRGISNLFGFGIEWDNETKSVYLGSRGGAALPAYSGSSSVTATPFAQESKSITVHTGVGIYVNDEHFVPRGSEGETVEVFLYNGTTYLPVRAISGLMNAEISWDQANKTVLLTMPAEDNSAELVASIAKITKKYTDMSTVLLPYYQYYLKVCTVLEGYLQEIKAEYLVDPWNIELEYMLAMHAAAYEAYNKEFGTYLEKSMSFYDFAKTLNKRVEQYAEGGYTAEELETLETNMGYLKDNLVYYSEYIQSSQPELQLKFVKDNFNETVFALVANIEVS